MRADYIARAFAAVKAEIPDEVTEQMVIDAIYRLAVLQSELPEHIRLEVYSSLLIQIKLCEIENAKSESEVRCDNFFCLDYCRLYRWPQDSYAPILVCPLCR